MAINFATETLKAVIAKGAASAASDVTTTDSAVAKFKAQDSQPQTTDTQDTQQDGSTTTSDTAPHAAPAFPSLSKGTLSDSALADLKTAYTEVKAALGDAGADLTTHGTGSDKAGSPLVKALTDATGEAAGTVREVLQQVHAVLRQEHTTEAGDQADGSASFWHDRLAQQDQTATDTTAATKTTATSDPTTTDAAATNTTATGAKAAAGSATDGAATATDAKATDTKTADAKDVDAKDAEAGHKLPDGHLWHDRLALQDGMPTTGQAKNGSGTATDGTTADWHHVVAQNGQQEGTDQGAAHPTVTTELTSAVDHFMQALDDLHLDPTHGHAVDQAHTGAA